VLHCVSGDRKKTISATHHLTRRGQQRHQEMTDSGWSNVTEGK